MARDENGEHYQTSRVERFEMNDKPGRTPENMFDFVVEGAQRAYAEEQDDNS